MTKTRDTAKEPGSAGPTADDQPRHRKLAAHFVDEITKITLAPNGASRIYFATWSVDDQGNPVRIDSELIMTRETMKRLAEVLPGALAQSDRDPGKDDGSGPRGGKGLFRNRSH